MKVFSEWNTLRLLVMSLHNHCTNLKMFQIFSDALLMLRIVSYSHY